MPTIAASLMMDSNVALPASLTWRTAAAGAGGVEHARLDILVAGKDQRRVVTDGAAFEFPYLHALRHT